MKLLRQLIVVRSVLLILCFSAGLQVREARAQFVVTDVGAVIQRITQIAAQIATKIEVANQFLQDTKVIDYLKAISGGVKLYNDSKNMVTTLKNNYQMAMMGIQQFKNNKNLNADQVMAMAKMYQYFMAATLRDITSLTNVIKPNVYQMNDKERMDFIDKIEGSAIKTAHLQTIYTAQINTFVQQKEMRSTDLDKLSILYAGAKTTSVAPTVASQKIGGMRNSIVGLLYMLSAVVGLVGIGRAYGKMSRGEDATGTITNWFGGCIAAIILVAFINSLFF